MSELEIDGLLEELHVLAPKQNSGPAHAWVLKATAFGEERLGSNDPLVAKLSDVQFPKAIIIAGYPMNWASEFQIARTMCSELLIAIEQKSAKKAQRVGEDALRSLHPLIENASLGLLHSGHDGDAVRAAFAEVESRTASMTGFDMLDSDVTAYGVNAMSRAFNSENGSLRFNDGETLSDKAEQEGYRLIFMGAMQGIRNPKGHANLPVPRERTYAYLGFASLLMYRLDDAEANIRE